MLVVAPALVLLAPPTRAQGAVLGVLGLHGTTKHGNTKTASSTVSQVWARAHAQKQHFKRTLQNK